jgi:uncharacterized membrane protein
MAQENDSRSAAVSSGRLESFSDAVFAIAITLLVLDIRQPAESGPLWDALVRAWPSLLAYALSFLLIGVVWVNHHSVFHLIARVDLGLMWFNLLLLMDVAFMPYPTELLADALNSQRGAAGATICYGGTLVVGGVFMGVIWLHASRRRLLHANVAPETVRAMGWRFLAAPLLCAALAPLALVQVGVTLAGYLALVAYYGVTGVRESNSGSGLVPESPE